IELYDPSLALQDCIVPTRDAPAPEIFRGYIESHVIIAENSQEGAAARRAPLSVRRRTLTRLSDRASPMRRSLGWIALALCGTGATLAQEAKPSPVATGQPAAAEAAMSPEAKAVLEADLAFVREYNKGDAKALAARFAED